MMKVDMMMLESLDTSLSGAINGQGAALPGEFSAVLDGIIRGSLGEIQAAIAAAGGDLSPEQLLSELAGELQSGSGEEFAELFGGERDALEWLKNSGVIPALAGAPASAPEGEIVFEDRQSPEELNRAVIALQVGAELLRGAGLEPVSQVEAGENSLSAALEPQEGETGREAAGDSSGRLVTVFEQDPLEMLRSLLVKGGGAAAGQPAGSEAAPGQFEQLAGAVGANPEDQAVPAAAALKGVGEEARVETGKVMLEMDKAFAEGKVMPEGKPVEEARLQKVPVMEKGGAEGKLTPEGRPVEEARLQKVPVMEKSGAEGKLVPEGRPVEDTRLQKVPVMEKSGAEGRHSKAVESPENTVQRPGAEARTAPESAAAETARGTNPGSGQGQPEMVRAGVPGSGMEVAGQVFRPESSQQQAPPDRGSQAGSEVNIPFQQPNVQGEEAVRAATVLQPQQSANLRESVMQQIEGRMVYLRENATNPAEIRLTLNPPELGELTIRVFSREGKLSARIIAESSVVREILESSISELRQRMNFVQIDFEQLDFSAGGEETGGSGSASSETEGGSGSRSQRDDRAGEPEAGAAVSPGARPEGSPGSIEYWA